MEKITEQSSPWRHLEQMSLSDILHGINEEDHKVAPAVRLAIPQIEALAKGVITKMQQGGRLFYIGSGTSGRLGVVDASECPPTFGVPDDWVIGLIAGGDGAIRKAVEFAEDDPHQAWEDLQHYGVCDMDVVVGIAASGTTPYVVHGLADCRKRNISTGCITCNPGSPVTREATWPVVIRVGPEFVTGSTRMKSGTAQKLVLNMLSTSVMIALGRVEDNKMVDMQLSNQKLVDRGSRILQHTLGLSYEKARELLLSHGSVRQALDVHREDSKD